MAARSRVPKLILILILTIILLILILQNLNPATIHILFWKVENFPIIALILIILVLGFILGLLLHPLIFRRKDKAPDIEETIRRKRKKEK